MTYLLPPLNALRAFEAAARHLSFKLAAHELCVTPGAVSQQIRGLEDRLGMRLFERRNRQVTLTEAGLRYLPAICDAFRRIASATDRLKPPHATAILRVGVHPRFDLARLEIGRFRRAHSSLGVRLIQPAGLHELLNGKLDVLIERMPARQAGYTCEALRGPGRVAARDYLIAPGGTADCPEVVAFRRWIAAGPALLKAG